jgi:hypothetical protein
VNFSKEFYHWLAVGYNEAQRLEIRNVGHFEALYFQATKPSIKCYIVQI